MQLLHTPKDLDRWVVQSAKAFQILERRLGTDWKQSTDSQGLSLLSLAFQNAGNISIARNDPAVACRNFRDSVIAVVRIFQLNKDGIAGAENYVRTGFFQTLLIALAIGDDDLTTKFADAFQVDGIAQIMSPPDSTYLAQAIKALVNRSHDVAVELLARPIPDVDPRFDGYRECLSVIAHRRWNELEATLRETASGWANFVRKNESGNPSVVCFVGGLGLLRLAERCCERKIDVTVPYIPSVLY